MSKFRKSNVAYEYLLEFIEKNLFAMNNKLPSENELALKLGLSRSTIRKALERLCSMGVIYKRQGAGTYIDKHRFIKLSTRTKFLELKKERGNELKVALIVQGQDKDANADFQRGVLSVFESNKVTLKVYVTDNRFANERFCLENLMQNNFDGFIVDGVKASLLNPNLALYRKCYEELEIPIVFYNNYYKELAYPHVVTDDRKSSHLLTSHLISQGHRNIAGIFVCDNYQALEKFHGMYETMLEHHIDLDDDYIKWCVSDEAHNERFQKEIERFLEQLPHCTAVVCCNAIIFKLLQQVKDKLKEEGRDLTIVSFDLNQKVAQKYNVTCSIHQGFEIGKTAALNLLSMIKSANFKKDIASYSCFVEPQLRLLGKN